MSTYTPKIDIAQFGNTQKAKIENANGEIQLLIEKRFKEHDVPVDDQSEQYLKSRKEN